MIAAIAVVLGVAPAIQAEVQPKPQPHTPPVKPAVKAVTVKILVTRQGFEPNAVTVPVGAPVTLVFERKVRRTCAREVIFDADGKHYEKDLPLDTPVTFRVTFKTAGTVIYHCAMNMFRGRIIVR
jgi:plastocyanin domain-containing protein